PEAPTAGRLRFGLDRKLPVPRVWPSEPPPDLRTAERDWPTLQGPMPSRDAPLRCRTPGEIPARASRGAPILRFRFSRFQYGRLRLHLAVEGRDLLEFGRRWGDGAEASGGGFPASGMCHGLRRLPDRDRVGYRAV